MRISQDEWSPEPCAQVRILLGAQLDETFRIHNRLHCESRPGERKFLVTRAFFSRRSAPAPAAELDHDRPARETGRRSTPPRVVPVSCRYLSAMSNGRDERVRTAQAGLVDPAQAPAGSG